MTYQFDVFLSYSSKDKPIVLDLATRLKKDGLRVWFDDWEIKPGDMITKIIDDALESSRVLILCMSKNASESDWAMMESGTFRFRDPANKNRRFIPLLLEDCTIKESLKQFAYVDWREKADKEYLRLLGVCKQEIEETQKPSPTGDKIFRSLSLGHTNWIRSVALSHDGKQAISGSNDKTLRLWDVNSGKCISIFEGHTAGVLSVALSHNGNQAISGSNDKTLRLWDVNSGNCLSIFEGHNDSVWSVALSHDAKRAISGSDDKTLRLWDINSGKCISIFEGHSSGVWSVALSHDAKRAISGSDDKTLRLWDVYSGKCISIFEGHTNSVLSVVLSHDGKRAISGSDDNTLRLWDVNSGKCISIFEGHTNSVWSIALSHDGKRAISDSSDNTLRLWDVNSGKCISIFKGHTDSVLSVALSHDGKRAISGSADKTLRLWDVNSGNCISVFKGHTYNVWSVAFSHDGKRTISVSSDNTLRLWDVNSGICLSIFKGHTASVWSVALSHDGNRAISGSSDKTLRLWDVNSGICLSIFKGHTNSVWSVAFSHDGKRAISGSDDNTLRLWDVNSGKRIAIFEGHTAGVISVAFSHDGKRAISGSSDNTLRLWDVNSGNCISIFEGHTAGVMSVAFSHDGKRAISGSSDNTLRLWDVNSGNCISIFEGHTDRVLSVALSHDGKRAVSGSVDNTVRLWDVNSGNCISIFEGHTDSVWSVAFSTDALKIYSSTENGVMRIWEVDEQSILVSKDDKSLVYTNAKVLLVGDSGVGKTGLSYRLTEGIFRESISTDGVWATQMKLPRSSSSEIERDIWLWDFAGQSDYRLIHQLYMDETALAVLVFNPQSENPFEGLSQWDLDLQRAARRNFNKVLVAGRCDRGGIMVSRETIERFRSENGYTKFIETSASVGTGCDTLYEAIINNIPWNDISWRSTPRIFKLIKDEIIKLKDKGLTLLRMGELKQHIELQLPDERFTIEELRAVVGLLSGPGMVWQLEFGDFVLLQPERINSYAAALIRKVRSHTDEIGCINEDDLLQGNLDYQDMKRLPHDEEQIVLRAMHQILLDHRLCLREHTDKGSLLIFPSYFKRERPPLAQHPLVLVTYTFQGVLDEIYTTLVVKLHNTTQFDKAELWRFAADFKTQAGDRLGLKMIKKEEGTAEMELYFEQAIPTEVRVMFIKYIHEHLIAKAQNVVRFRHFACPKCGNVVESRDAIEKRLQKGWKDILCLMCENRVPLWDLIEEKFSSEEFLLKVREMEEQSKATIDNESRELILVGHTYAIAGEAGQIYRQYTNSDHGIDGEIEFKTNDDKASGKRLYLQLKSGDSYLYNRKEDDAEIFTIKNERWASYWQQQAYPVMLVIRTSDGEIRWMEVSEYLKRESQGGKKVKQIIFDGEPFTALNLRRMRDKILGK